MSGNCPESNTPVMIGITSSMDAVACVRKYLVATSCNKRIIASMLISTPTHVSSQ
jgi:hypothetical protein